MRCSTLCYMLYHKHGQLINFRLDCTFMYLLYTSSTIPPHPLHSHQVTDLTPQKFMPALTASSRSSCGAKQNVGGLVEKRFKTLQVQRPSKTWSFTSLSSAFCMTRSSKMRSLTWLCKGVQRQRFICIASVGQGAGSTSL